MRVVLMEAEIFSIGCGQSPTDSPEPASNSSVMLILAIQLEAVSPFGIIR